MEIRQNILQSFSSPSSFLNQGWFHCSVNIDQTNPIRTETNPGSDSLKTEICFLKWLSLELVFICKSLLNRISFWFQHSVITSGVLRQDWIFYKTWNISILDCNRGILPSNNVQTLSDTDVWMFCLWCHPTFYNHKLFRGNKTLSHIACSVTLHQYNCTENQTILTSSSHSLHQIRSNEP